MNPCLASSMDLSSLIGAPYQARAVLRGIVIDLNAARQMEAEGDELEMLALLGDRSSAPFGEVYDVCGLEAALWALGGGSMGEKNLRILSLFIAQEGLRKADGMDEHAYDTMFQFLHCFNPGYLAHRDIEALWLNWHRFLESMTHVDDVDQSIEEAGIRLVMAVLAPSRHQIGEAWESRYWAFGPSDCLDMARNLRVAANPAVRAARSMANTARLAQKRWQDGTNLKFDFLGEELETQYWVIEDELRDRLTSLIDLDIAEMLGLVA